MYDRDCSKCSGLRAGLSVASSFSLSLSGASESSEDAGERDCGSLVRVSREKSSIEAGSDGDVVAFGDDWPC